MTGEFRRVSTREENRSERRITRRIATREENFKRITTKTEEHPAMFDDKLCGNTDKVSLSGLQ